MNKAVVYQKNGIPEKEETEITSIFKIIKTKWQTNEINISINSIDK